MMYASTHFAVESIHPVPTSFGDLDVRVSSWDYRIITRKKAWAERHRKRIVRVSTERASQYGHLKESHLVPLGACWLGAKAKPKAGLLILVRITAVPAWLAWLVAFRSLCPHPRSAPVNKTI